MGGKVGLVMSIPVRVFYCIGWRCSSSSRDVDGFASLSMVAIMNEPRVFRMLVLCVADALRLGRFASSNSVSGHEEGESRRPSQDCGMGGGLVIDLTLSSLSPYI